MSSSDAAKVAIKARGVAVAALTETENEAYPTDAVAIGSHVLVTGTDRAGRCRSLPAGDALDWPLRSTTT